MMKRNAISLLELLSVMSGCTVVLALSASLIHHAMRSESHTRHFFDVERNVQRLSRQFRADVHAGAEAMEEATPHGAGSALRLIFPDGASVVYSRSDGILVRTRFEDDKPRSREEFQIGREARVEFDELEDSRRCSMSIHTEPPAAGEGGEAAVRTHEIAVNLHVVATFGRDRRFSAMQRAAGEGR